IVGLAAATALCTAGGPADAAPPTSKGKVQLSQAKPDPKLLATERAAARSAVSTAGSRAALATVQGQIAGYVAKNGTKYTFGSY
ncbi:hypothetical protein QOZ75_29655, partial [Pseudomonas aeruginosa]|uniref:hypothetical protein n=1 Tax=Pseudomonas aeruginosa TaxID=287 RepID=UPI0034574426